MVLVYRDRMSADIAMVARSDRDRGACPESSSTAGTRALLPFGSVYQDFQPQSHPAAPCWCGGCSETLADAVVGSATPLPARTPGRSAATPRRSGRRHRRRSVSWDFYSTSEWLPRGDLVWASARTERTSRPLRARRCARGGDRMCCITRSRSTYIDLTK